MCAEKDSVPLGYILGGSTAVLWIKTDRQYDNTLSVALGHLFSSHRHEFITQTVRRRTALYYLLKYAGQLLITVT